MSILKYAIVSFLIMFTCTLNASTYIKGTHLIEGTTSTATAGATTTLVLLSQPNQIFTGGSNQNIVLPDATTLQIGYQFKIINQSTGTLTIKDAGSNTLATVSAGTDVYTLLSAQATANGSWAITPNVVLSMGAFGSTPNANGAVISGTVLTLEPADATHPGGVTTSAQTFAGTKSFGTILDSTDATDNIGAASGVSRFQNGYFSNTVSAGYYPGAGGHTVAALVNGSSPGLYLYAGGSNAYQMSSDGGGFGLANTGTGVRLLDVTGTTFNFKNESTNVTYFNGDASGIVTLGNAQIKGLTTAGPVKTDSSGNLTSEAQLAISRGGTGQATKSAAFDALSPMSASGDIIYGGTSGTGTRLPKGSDTQILTLASGLPTWAAPATSGTVTSVGLSVPATSIFGVTGSPVTSSGTLGLTTTGTSGGIPYFSSTSALSSSALLAANQLVLGGGAATTPATLGSLGTTTTVLHGNAAGAPTFGAVSLTADVSGILPIANGGTGVAYGVLNDNSSARNCNFTTSVGSNALTIALTDASGSTPSSSSPCSIPFRSASAGSGAVTTVNVTGATTLVISSGSTLGFAASTTYRVWIYAINNSGTAELAAAMTQVDQASRQTTTAEGGAGAADSNRVLYSTTARSNVPVFLLGYAALSEATPGTWVTNSSDISFGNKFTDAIYAIAENTAGTSVSSADAVIPFANTVEDNHNAISGSGTSWVFTAPRAGIYNVYSTGQLSSQVSVVGDQFAFSLKLNGTFTRRVFRTVIDTISSVTNSDQGAVMVKMAAGDTIAISCNSTTTGTLGTGAGLNMIYISSLENVF